MVQRVLDLSFALFLFAGSIWFWIIADGFPESRRFAQADADFWPKIVFGTMALISGILFIRSVLALRSAGPTADGGITAEGRATAIRIAVMGGLIFAYYVAFQHVGFVIATVLFLWLASFTIPYRNHLVRLIFAPVFALFLMLFFTRVLTLPLPRGSGIFYDLNVLFY